MIQAVRVLDLDPSRSSEQVRPIERSSRFRHCRAPSQQSRSAADAGCEVDNGGECGDKTAASAVMTVVASEGA